MGKRYEVVYVTGASIHVIVDAENETEATEKAERLALDAWHTFCRDVDERRINDHAQVFMGEVEDVAYVDEITPKPVYADGWSSTFGGSR